MCTPLEIEYDASLPLVDREQLEMLLMADDNEDAAALIREIYQLFRNESDEKLIQLEAASASLDALKVRNTVHFIAGSAGNLGMVRLNAFLRAIEEAVDTQQVSEPTALVAPIRSEYQAACKAFEQELLS